VEELRGGIKPDFVAREKKIQKWEKHKKEGGESRKHKKRRPAKAKHSSRGKSEDISQGERNRLKSGFNFRDDRGVQTGRGDYLTRNRSGKRGEEFQV